MYSVNTKLRIHINQGITGTRAQFGRNIQPSDTESVITLIQFYLALCHFKIQNDQLTNPFDHKESSSRTEE